VVRRNRAYNRISMKQVFAAALLACASAAALFAQEKDAALEAERQELAAAVSEASTSSFDMIRVLEAHLRKYPNTTFRAQIVNLLAKAAVDTRDEPRIVRYGEPALANSPNDVTLLDRVSRGLLNAGGKDNAKRALEYATRFEDYIIRVPVPLGYDPAKNQEDHDRMISRALLYQSRAYMTLGNFDEARKKATLAFKAYADEPGARQWAEALDRLGKREEAIERMADAFAIPDPRATDDERAFDRQRLGEWYRALHNGSEAGLGDVILAAYDRTSAEVQKRQAQLRSLDPNLGVTDPMRYKLSALGGGTLDLAAMRGKVLIFDFWATWCAPCRAQHPLYEELKRRFRGRDDVVFLSVDTDEDHNVVKPFLDEQHWSGDVYFDSGLVKLLNVNSIPTTLIADKQGRLVSRMDGFNSDKFVDQVTARIQAALAGAPAEAAGAGTAASGQQFPPKP
jgi:thiol-disulfide isomerase/thioredoxin/nucleotide-binding universal stress UspA family protein